MDATGGLINRPIEVDSTALDDEQLLRRARSSPAEFAILYDRHVVAVYRYLLAKVGNVHDAEDLTSQTFLEAFENLGSYRGTGVVRAWLFRIARNKSVDTFRRRRPESALSDDDDWIDESAEMPEAAAERGVLIAQVAEQLTHLTPDRADAVALRIFGGLDVGEIAHLMGKPEPAVRMLIHRGIHDLQNHFAVRQPEKSQ
jgi:RNA polymerase sigma-70 factor (ECF subfamily)